MASANAAASRVPRSPSTWGTTVKPSRSRSPGVAVERDDPPGDRGRADRVEGVGHRGRGDAGRLLGRARRGEPGLAPAGHRRLGDDQDLGAEAAGHRASTARMSRIVRTVPSDGAGHLGLRALGPQRSSRRRPRGCASRRRPRGHHLQRVAEPAVGEPEVEQRLAAGGAHRPEVVQPQPGARGAACAPARCWRPGRAPATRRGRGRRRPSTRSASPAAPGRATRGSCAGSIEPSASQKQTTSAVGGLEAGVRGGAEPALRDARRRSRRARRRSPRSRRSSRCRRRSPGSRPAAATAPTAATRPRRGRAGRRRPSGRARSRP